MLQNSVSPLEPMVRKLSYWADLDATDTRAIRDLPHRIKTVERHGHLARDGENTTHTAVLLSGFAFRHKIANGGARQILAIHMKGDMLDLQNSVLGVADHNVQALTNIEVALIPHQAITELAVARPAVGSAMWFDTLVDASIFREWIVNVGRRDSRTRLAHLLCEFSLRLKVAGLGEASDYELPMTQEQLGDCTGLTPVHINRTLKALEAEKLITRRSSRSITIGDWNKLAAAGDFEANYLHLRKGEAALA